MIIPVSPVPVRISLETASISNNGYVSTDIDVSKLIRDADSVLYEINVCKGVTVLYRSNTYQVNKSAGTIIFDIMVGSDLFSATLSASNKRCTFAKIDMGLSEGTVSNMINNAIDNLKVSGYSDNLVDVDATDGFTLTIPYVEGSSSIVCAGHLMLWETEAGTAYETDFFYDPYSGFTCTNDTVPSPFASLILTVGTVKTGRFYNASNISAFNCAVTFYYNPDGCYLATGSFTPADGG